MKPRRARPDERDAPDYQRRARDDPREKAATPPMLIISTDVRAAPSSTSLNAADDGPARSIPRA